MREIVKTRTVGQSLVVTIPQPIAKLIDLSPGDKIMIEVISDRQLALSKEHAEQPSSRRLELELALLEARRARLDADASYKVAQWNSSTPCQPEMTEDEAVFELMMKERNLELAQLHEEIADKRLRLFEANG